jgi:hypothetical protein
VETVFTFATHRFSEPLVWRLVDFALRFAGIQHPLELDASL